MSAIVIGLIATCTATDSRASSEWLRHIRSDCPKTPVGCAITGCAAWAEAGHSRGAGDPNVFLVSKAVGGPITIIDQVGDQFVEIDIRDPALANEVDGSLEIEPLLLRTFPVSGSVWVQGSNPEGVIEWIEIGVDGIERNRVTATTLTTTNR